MTQSLKYVDHLLRELSGLEESDHLYIVAGEGDSLGDKRVIEAVRQARERGADVEVLLGAAVIVDDEDEREALQDLTELGQGTICLRYSKDMRPRFDYCVGNTSVYVEAPHDPLASESEREVAMIPVAKRKQAIRHYEKLYKEFVSNGAVEEVRPGNGPLYVTSSEMGQMLDMIERRHLVYDFLSRKELSELATKVRNGASSEGES